jgi:hypothetical protein
VQEKSGVKPLGTINTDHASCPNSTPDWHARIPGEDYQDPDPVVATPAPAPAPVQAAPTPAPAPAATPAPAPAPAPTQAPYVPVYIPPVPSVSEFAKMTADKAKVIAPKNPTDPEVYNTKPATFDPFNLYENPTPKTDNSFKVVSNKLKPLNNIEFVPNGLDGVTYEDTAKKIYENFKYLS